ncbi:MAG: adenylate/guanylate cyclase domain-containing protein [Planctomycetota bacterium]
MTTNLRQIETPTECSLLIAFVDLTHFSKFSQDKTDRELFDFIDSLYELIGRIIEEENGEILKFIGDGALIVFPEERLHEGVRALHELREEVNTFLRSYQFDSILRIKAHFGPVIYGPLGTRREKHFDVIGQNVNETALLKYNGKEIVFSEELQAKLKALLS